MLAPALKKLKYVANDIVPCSLSSRNCRARSCMEDAPSVPTYVYIVVRLPHLRHHHCSLAGWPGKLVTSLK